MSVILDFPNPEAIRNAGRGAMMRGAPSVAFAVQDVFALADALDKVMTAIAQQNGMLAGLDGAGRLVLQAGRKLIDDAKAGDVPATDDALIVFEAALNGLEGALVEKIEPTDDAETPPAN